MLHPSGHQWGGTLGVAGEHSLATLRDSADAEAVGANAIDDARELFLHEKLLSPPEQGGSQKPNTIVSG